MTNKEETTPLSAEEVLKLQNELQNCKEKWAFSQQWLYKLTDKCNHLEEGLKEITAMHGNEETLRKVAAEYLEDYTASPQVEDRWISVEKRLPNEGGRYWCYVKELTDLGYSYFQWNCSYNEIEKRFSDSTFKGGETVTHWMPLPQQPLSTLTSIK